MTFLIFQVNADFLINQVTKYFYTRHFTSLVYFKKIFCSPPQNLLETSTFYHILTMFKVIEVCNISSNCWLLNISANKIFLHKNLRSPSQILLEISFFFPFLLVLTVDKVCYISNKYQALNNLTKHQYIYTRDFISLFHFGKELAPSIAKFFQNIHFLPLFHYF